MDGQVGHLSGTRLASAALLLAAALVISACGGGGSSTPATTPDAGPVSVAGAGATVGLGTSVMLDGSGSADPSGRRLIYAWSVTASPAGSTAQVSDPAAAQPTFTPDKPGTYTLSLVVSNGQTTSSPSSLTIVSTNASLPTIAIDQIEPVSGPVGLSLSGTVAGAVTWYADLQLLGNGSGATGAYEWDATPVTNGNHLILARIQTAANTFQEVRRTVTVGNSPITLTASSSVASGTVVVDARALSTNGMSTVAASLDGGPAVTLVSPNACSSSCPRNDLWRFQFAGVTSGDHSVVVTATDGSAASRTLTVAVTVSNAPRLVVSHPSDGQLVNGHLDFDGLATTDKAGAVTVTARLEALPVPVVSSVTGNGTAFSGSYDLTGVAPGSYTLTVVATDQGNAGSTIARTVVVTSSPALAYTPVFTLPSGASVLAVDGSGLLYRTSDGTYVLRDLDSSTEVVLQSTATLQFAGDWQLTSGRTVATAKDGDCTPNWNCAYEWAADGTRRNLSEASHLADAFPYQENPVSSGGYVMWTNWGAGAGSYTLYDVATGSFTPIPPGDGVNYLGNIDYGVAPNNGHPIVYYWGQTGGSGTASTFDIFAWSAGVSTPVTHDGQRNVYVQTDGVRAAWQSGPPGGTVDGTFKLKTVPVGSTTASTVSTTATAFKLVDGVLAWVESTPTSRAVKASTSAGPIVTLSSASTANLAAAGSGRVAYSQAGKLYTWDSTTNASTLRLETPPGGVWISGGTLIFNVGASVYRVAL